ncbi:hypothetical protein BI364_08615 [Acidihalobacter yilgarnensis]|uniref:Lipoprotein SmpA/OmlA domain-containing protein n=1 Tax=Acidihalobacter yilgarnensis TaxID=2819280 RepID=A0A1D8INL2_9GAMM|nr:hypothetical protein [Acidihalobacter yilgarnensis]AOU98014.1 hypothetical protein BI364_08615 [Acidihalobacter yilgarnensis]
MVSRTLLALSLILAGGLASPVMAEVLIMPNGHPEAARLPMQPHRGMTMQQVLKRFGQPTQRLVPIDTPPITRWVYPKYTVYFEDRYVIHTVVHPGVHLAP